MIDYERDWIEMYFFLWCESYAFSMNSEDDIPSRISADV